MALRQTPLTQYALMDLFQHITVLAQDEKSIHSIQSKLLFQELIAFFSDPPKENSFYKRFKYFEEKVLEGDQAIIAGWIREDLENNQGGILLALKQQDPSLAKRIEELNNSFLFEVNNMPAQIKTGHLSSLPNLITSSLDKSHSLFVSQNYEEGLRLCNLALRWATLSQQRTLVVKVKKKLLWGLHNWGVYIINNSVKPDYRKAIVPLAKSIILSYELAEFLTDPVDKKNFVTVQLLFHYHRGLIHYEKREYAEAAKCFSFVYRIHEHHIKRDDREGLLFEKNSSFYIRTKLLKALKEVVNKLCELDKPKEFFVVLKRIGVFFKKHPELWSDNSVLNSNDKIAFLTKILENLEKYAVNLFYNQNISQAIVIYKMAIELKTKIKKLSSNNSLQSEQKKESILEFNDFIKFIDSKRLKLTETNLAMWCSLQYHLSTNATTFEEMKGTDAINQFNKHCIRNNLNNLLYYLRLIHSNKMLLIKALSYDFIASEIEKNPEFFRQFMSSLDNERIPFLRWLGIEKSSNIIQTDTEMLLPYFFFGDKYHDNITFARELGLVFFDKINYYLLKKHNITAILIDAFGQDYWDKRINKEFSELEEKYSLAVYQDYCLHSFFPPNFFTSRFALKIQQIQTNLVIEPNDTNSINKWLLCEIALNWLNRGGGVAYPLICMNLVKAGGVMSDNSIDMLLSHHMPELSSLTSFIEKIPPEQRHSVLEYIASFNANWFAELSKKEEFAALKKLIPVSEEKPTTPVSLFWKSDRRNYNDPQFEQRFKGLLR